MSAVPGPPQQPNRVPPSSPNPATGGQPPVSGVEKTPWTAYVKPAIWTIVALYVILFVFFNTDSVTINFLFAKAVIPLIFVLVGMALVGAGLYAGVMAMTRRRSKKAAAATATGKR